nr:hypothetical protein Iba_chr04eCG5710 [Ipomoea batatas]
MIADSLAALGTFQQGNWAIFSSSPLNSERVNLHDLARVTCVHRVCSSYVRNVPPSIWHGVLLHDHLLVLLASFRMLSGQEDVTRMIIEDVTRMIILERGIEMQALSSRVAYDVQDRVNVDGEIEFVTL